MQKPTSSHFSLTFTAQGENDLKAAEEWLASLSEDAVRRFASAMTDGLTDLCHQWAKGFRPIPDEAASLYFAHPVFQKLVSTIVRRQRRSNAGTGRVFYDVVDAGGDGQPDLLRVLAIRHSAARPLSVENQEE